MSGLNDEAKTLLAAAIPGWATTVRPDGSLHSTVVWVDVDGDDVIFNTAIGRAKEKHLRAARDGHRGAGKHPRRYGAASGHTVDAGSRT